MVNSVSGIVADGSGIYDSLFTGNGAAVVHGFATGDHARSQN
jgi:hypothetical protein